MTRSPRLATAALLGVGIALLALVTLGRIPGHGLWVTEVLTAADGRARVNTSSVDSIVLRRDAENRALEFYLAGVWLE